VLPTLPVISPLPSDFDKLLRTNWLMFTLYVIQEAQEQMNTSDMSLRGGCGETIDCCGMTESCGCC
jgi:hypothetical protein